MPAAEVMVIGVYPSALHVRWQPHGSSGVRALAVAPEPWPFWDGGDAADRVAQWKTDLPWLDTWGTATNPGPVNGSSGRRVRDEVLGPLGISIDDVWTTDVLPYFFVHRGAGSQGDAMTKRYDPWAAGNGLPAHDLPYRPSPSALVTRAIAEEGERLADEIRSSSCHYVVTLGNEALQVIHHLADEHDLPQRLHPDDTYGRTYQASVLGRHVTVLPLVHPGQRSATWRAVHEAWTANAGQLIHG
ncbi:hypothetical protein ACFP6A_09900 [Quadrisphaera sp. GCM10027208]|uniref:hypothetical protein n=1 Tax=Quadrisphaera sp. GCM10027208 TaxID=3273423 RepID=UPI0036214FCB